MAISNIEPSGNNFLINHKEGVARSQSVVTFADKNFAIA